MTLPLADALRDGVVVLDGGLATELERAGHDLSSALWSARLLRDDPGAVVTAHAAFFAAGAQIATTASYQASAPGFASLGVGRAEADALVRRSVALAREAADAVPGPTWVAASVGPYGAVLADGSEYTGGYAREMPVRELRAFHRPRLEVLASAGPDVLALETVPAAAEAEALLAEVQELGLPVWLSLTAVVDADGVVRTRLGERAADTWAMARDVAQVLAVGVNCTSPGEAGAAVAVAAAASGKPVVVYPNSGERWDAAGRRWSGRAGTAQQDAARWVADGARLVGGCCRVAPADIPELVALARS